MWPECNDLMNEKSFESLLEKVKFERESCLVYPPEDQMFAAFEATPLDEVRVVILGQDPYHQPNQAMGLSFSVGDGKLPKSLINIFKELLDDLGIDNQSGDLSSWAKQGVFLLNTILSVRDSEPGSHRNLGWESFTDGVISLIDDKVSPVVFILWGKYAQSKLALIDQSRHFVIQSPHPSPLSSYRGFFGSKPFSTTNNFLEIPIDWSTD